MMSICNFPNWIFWHCMSCQIFIVLCAPKSTDSKFIENCTLVCFEPKKCIHCIFKPQFSIRALSKICFTIFIIRHIDQCSQMFWKKKTQNFFFKKCHLFIKNGSQIHNLATLQPGHPSKCEARNFYWTNGIFFKQLLLFFFKTSGYTGQFDGLWV